MWKVVQCAVQGRGHIKESIPCQDKTHYIIDEAAASRARIRAFQNAAKESAIAQKYADQVSKFIEEAEFVEE